MSLLWSRAELVAAAEVDPWSDLELLRGGDPARIEQLAAAFYRAGGDVADARAADARSSRFAREGYVVDGCSPVDASAEARRATRTLREGAESLPLIARTLTSVAEDLVTTTRTATQEVEALESNLARLAATAPALLGSRALSPSDRTEVEANLLRRAAAQVRGAAAHTRATVEAYEHTLARATRRMADLGYTPPGALPEAAEVRTTPMRVGSSPAAVARWWAGLTTAQQVYLQDHCYGTLGLLVGLPATVLSAANVHRLKDHVRALSRRLSSLPRNDPQRIVLQDQINRDNGILRELGKHEAQVGAPTMLIAYDPGGPDGQTGAAISYGNPDTAANTAVTVPGTGTSVADLGPTGQRARDLYATMGGSRAVVLWVDGAEPQTLPAAALDSYAAADAPRLVHDITGLRAAHDQATGAHGHLTLIGHSYGSYIAGRAMTAGAGADDVIVTGSPGVGVDHAKDLGIDPHHVWSGQAGDDPIMFAARRFTPDPLTGNNPSDSAFGGQHIDVDGSHGHGQYYRPGSESLINIAQIANGAYDQVHTVPAPDYRGPRELLGDSIALGMTPVYTGAHMTGDLADGDPLAALSDGVAGVRKEGTLAVDVAQDLGSTVLDLVP